MSLPFFQSLRVQQVAPTSLCKGGKYVCLIRGPRQIEDLVGERRKERSVYYEFQGNSFKHGISFDEAVLSVI